MLSNALIAALYVAVFLVLYWVTIRCQKKGSSLLHNRKSKKFQIQAVFLSAACIFVVSASSPTIFDPALIAFSVSALYLIGHQEFCKDIEEKQNEESAMRRKAERRLKNANRDRNELEGEIAKITDKLQVYEERYNTLHDFIDEIEHRLPADIQQKWKKIRENLP